MANVQSILEVTLRQAYSGAVKPTQAQTSNQASNPLAEADYVVFEQQKLLRENWLSPVKNDNLSLKDLRVFLRKNKQFPDKYRSVIWSFLLDLPGNVLCYDNYLKKGVHREFEHIEQIFPLKNQTLVKKLGRVMSSLAHYSPIFSDKQVVPYIAFPFVKLLSNDECMAFEVVLTFMLHWGQHMLENYPYPSTTLISFVTST